MTKKDTPALVGLTGYAGSGKDLIGALLAMRGYTRIAFADAVRMEVADHIGRQALAPVELDEDLRCVLNDFSVSDVWSKPTTPTMRRILQQWGTEYRRNQDQDYWVKIVDDQFKALDAPAVITDVRHANECEWLRHRGGVLLRVRRNASNDPHSSERAIDALAVDAEIDNTGTLQELPGRVLAALGVTA